MATASAPNPASAGGAIQCKMTQFGDITSSNSTYDWMPHRTQQTTTDGVQGNGAWIPGRGADVHGTVTAPSGFATLPSYGGLDADTQEATRVRVDRLGPTSPGQAAPPLWLRPAQLDLAVQTAGGYLNPPGYVDIQLLPAFYGGEGDAQNRVAVPQPTAHEFNAWIANTLHRLVWTGGAWVSYEVRATSDKETINTDDVAFTRALTMEWQELDDQGNPIDGTAGEVSFDVPSPTQFVGAPLTAPGATGPLQIGAHANRAHAPASRDARTAINWQTEVSWSSTHSTGDGVSMEARRLGPDHLQGTQPAHKDKKAKSAPYIWDQRTDALATAAANKKEYIAGHLLNHHVGGPGNDARNLAPIPGDVNSKMATDVEGPIKDLVNHEHAWVYYRADVTHAFDNGAGLAYPSRLDFEWHQLDREGTPCPTRAASRRTRSTRRAPSRATPRPSPRIRTPPRMRAG